MGKALFQVHRPACREGLVGHARHKRAIESMKSRGSLGGRAFWISGPSGIGKTSMAYLIAGDVCDRDNFIEADAGELTPKGLDDIERLVRCRAIGDKSGRAVLVNEAHGLRKDSVRKLLVVLERIPGHVTWVFTTTALGQQALFDDIDSHPLMSRCVKFELNVEDCATEIVERAREIAELEGLGGATTREFQKLAKECRFNFRDMLTHIEAGKMVRDIIEPASTAYDMAAIQRLMSGVG
jgi:DNA polymerase III delta prime subunit